MLQEDEFDVYFARAALQAKELAEQQQALDVRRGSVPNESLFGTQLTVAEPSSTPRRTASCKYPSSRRTKGSPSPRPGEGNGGRSPRRRSSTVQPEGNNSPPARNTLQTPDADTKSHSAPHSRSSSWKKMHRPSSSREIKGGDGGHTPRSSSNSSLSARRDSLPLDEAVTAKLEQLQILQADNVCVVRNFTTSSRGIINRGDSFKRKKRAAAAAAASGGRTGKTPTTSPKIVRVTPPSPASAPDLLPLDRLVSPCRPRGALVTQHSRTSSSATPPLRVLVLGRHGVGKTALLQQFMTSEYMGAVETNFGE